MPFSNVSSGLRLMVSFLFRILFSSKFSLKSSSHVECIMIGLSFATKLNRDIVVLGMLGERQIFKYVHPANRANERNPSFLVGYAQGVFRHIICFYIICVWHGEKFICSWFTSLVTFCAGFTHSGTQQCLCGELFFLHLGMNPD